MFERDYRDLAHVPRWGIAPVNKRQSVAEHSYFVVLYTIQILEFLKYEGCGLPKSEELEAITYAALHDREECFMTDIAGPVKRSIIDQEKYDSYVKEMSIKIFNDYLNPAPHIKKIIKVADLIDEYGYWLGEIKSGNKFAGHEQLLGQIRDRLEKSIMNLDIEGRVPYSLSEAIQLGLHKPKTLPKVMNNDVVT